MINTNMINDELAVHMQKALNMLIEEQVDKTIEESVAKFRKKLEDEKAVSVTKILTYIFEQYTIWEKELVIRVPIPQSMNTYN